MIWPQDGAKQLTCVFSANATEAKEYNQSCEDEPSGIPPEAVNGTHFGDVNGEHSRSPLKLEESVAKRTEHSERRIA